MIWMLEGFFRDFPKELLEAGRDRRPRRAPARSSASSSRLSLPGLGVATLFGFLVAWNEFVIALTLTRTPGRPDHAGRHLDADHAVPDALG